VPVGLTFEESSKVKQYKKKGEVFCLILTKLKISVEKHLPGFASVSHSRSSQQ
jgi:hypothetical protein